MRASLEGVLLVIDLGTQSIRGTVLEASGAVLTYMTLPVETSRDEVRSEQSPREWSAHVDEILSAVSRDRALAARLAGIAACGTLAGAVCVGPAGEPLREAILYSDKRPAPLVDEIEACAEFDSIRRRTGWRCFSGDLLPQALYLKRAFPDCYRRAAHILDSTGYLNYLLTGKAVLDSYSRFGCYATPESACAVPATLAEELEIDPGKLGSVKPVGSVIGSLRRNLAERYRLPACPVFCVPYDSMTAYLGAGLNRPGEALDISGTVTSFGVCHTRQVIDPSRRIYSLPYGDNGAWLVRGSNASAGGALEWARGTLARTSHDSLNRLVESSPPGANGVLFLPYLAGERTPLWNPDAAGVFFGLRTSTTGADLMRAVVEGICFSLRHIQSVIEERGVRVGEVLLAGGVARNSLYNRIKADVTGKVLRPLADFELTTLGAAAIAGTSLGWFGSHAEASGVLLRKGAPLEPEPVAARRYDEIFKRYLALAECVSPLFAQQRSRTFTPEKEGLKC